MGQLAKETTHARQIGNVNSRPGWNHVGWLFRMATALSHPLSPMHKKLFPENIELNVGGKFYSTSAFTLTREPDSLLGKLFSGQRKIHKDANGKFVIDRDGVLFRYILDYLRSKKLHLPEDFSEIERLKLEADYYELQELKRQLECFQKNRTKRVNLAQAKFGFITLHIRSTYAFGRSGLAEVKFRKLQRILVCGRVSLCREVFGVGLNETRDPNPDGNRYTNRFFLKYNHVESAFQKLRESGFILVSSSGGKSGHDLNLQQEEDKWFHFNIYVFFRQWNETFSSYITHPISRCWQNIIKSPRITWSVLASFRANFACVF